MPAVFARAVDLAAPKAKIVLIGLAAESHSVPTALSVRKELQIVGSMIYIDELPESLDLLQSGRIRTAFLITGKVGLHELNGVLRNFISPERIKTRFRFSREWDCTLHRAWRARSPCLQSHHKRK